MCLAVLVASSGCSVLITPGENAATPDELDGGLVLPCAEQAIQVTLDSNDGYIHGFDWYNSGWNGDLYIGFYQGTPIWGYFRFQIPEDVPPFDVVTLSLWGDGDDSWGPQDLLAIGIENGPDPAAVDGPGDAPDRTNGRPLLNPEVPWPGTGGGLTWLPGEWNESPNLFPALQPLLDQGGLQGGQHIQLWVHAVLDPMRDADIAAVDSWQDDGRAAILKIGCTTPL